MNSTQLIRLIAFIVLPLFAVLVSISLLGAGILIPLVLVGCILMFLLTVSMPSWLLPLCVVLSLLPGRTAAGFGYWEIFSLALIGRWACQIPFTGKIFGKLHSKFTFVCIIGFTVLLIYHGLPNVLGVGGAGGRRMVVMAGIAILLSYLLLTDQLDIAKLPWLPWVSLIPGLVLTGFDVVNLLIPQLIPVTYALYSAQNWELVAGYFGADSALGRIAGLRDLGLSVGILGAIYFGMNRNLNFWLIAFQILSVVFGTALVTLAGYRNYVARLGIAVLVACYHRSKKTLALAMLCATGFCMTIIVIQNQYDPFPLSVQRALSFLPANWDWRTADSAQSGITWRNDIRNIFIQEIFPDNWLIGRGRVYDERIAAMTWMAESPIYQTEYFVLTQNYHSGLASSLDFVGSIGTLFLGLAALRGIFNCIVILRSRNVAQPWHLWVVLMYISSLPVFWYTGFFERSFPFFSMIFCLLEVGCRQIRQPSLESQRFEEEVVEYSVANRI